MEKRIEALAMMATMASLATGPVERDYPGGTQRGNRCRIGTKASKLPESSRDRRRKRKKERMAKKRGR